MNKKILIAAALPYANGSLHFGHLSGLIGADILARYFRLSKNEVLFVSGSDCYGTPIIFEAEKKKVKPADIAEKYDKEFRETLIDGMSFSYDFFTKTTSKEHHNTVQEIFLELYRKKYIYKKTENLPYCNGCKKFLPDRYIEGECNICNYKSARGDQCDDCGNLMNVKDLKNLKCKICNSDPIFKNSEHFFLKLSEFEKKLKGWVRNSEGWRINAKNFTTKLLEHGLHDRSITRDTTWGISVPVSGYESKKIYVWFEAVCAYLSASKEWAAENKKDWSLFWKGNNVTHYYVHGKDNIPFHSIIWPSILMGYGDLHLPDKIISSEYLTLEKRQFSKSRNWSIKIIDFLKIFDSESLRYYLTANGSENSDSDFSWNEFLLRINSELIGNFGNYIFRVLSFADKNFKGNISFPKNPCKKSVEFIELSEKTFHSVGKSIEKANFRKAMQDVFRVAEHGNRYIDDTKPWSSLKKNQQKAEENIAVAAHVVKSLGILISPFLPKTAEKICSQVNIDYSKINWQPPVASKIIINNPNPLYNKIEKKETERFFLKKD